MSHPANNRYRGPDGRAMDEVEIGREETPPPGIPEIPLPLSGIPSLKYQATCLYIPLLSLGDHCLILASPANGYPGLNPDWHVSVG